MASDLTSLTATAAVRLIHGGKLNPVDLMEAYLDRIATRDPMVRAFAHFDSARARASAASVRPGPLQGIPVGVKDVLDTADMPSQYGSPIWSGWQPKADSAAVAWVRAAGASVCGKTVTTEFATRKPGPTMNPANPAHTPGGSSSGSAAGVGAGLFPLAYATQTAGSVIRPAAFCGTVGYKPSYGLISRIGMKIMSDSLDTVGVIARTVSDCALFAGAVSGRDLGDPDTNPGRAPRIAICRSPSWPTAAPETHELLDRVTTALARAGATLSDRELRPSFAALLEAHPIVMNAESARALGWELTHHAEQISDLLRERLEWGLSRSESALRDAYAVFASTQHAFPDVMDGLDVLVTPSAPGEAPKRLDWTGDPPSTSSGRHCTSPASPSPPAPAPMVCHSVSRSSAATATTKPCWPGRVGWKPQLHDWIVPDAILFAGDPHRNLAPILRACAAHPPGTLILLGDCDLPTPLAHAFAPAIGQGWDIRWILGNHDTETEAAYDNLTTAPGDLGLCLTTIGRLRIAGLPGVFKPRVWHPAEGPPSFHTRTAFQAALRPGEAWRGGLPLFHRDTIFPEDFQRLAALRCDILVTHEAPSSHPHGFAVIDALAESCGARLIVHGHHHQSYEARLPNGIRVRGLGLAEPWRLPSTLGQR